jgi:hypothetical protein
LWCELAPVCSGKRFGKACHAGKEMSFPIADGPFGGVCAIDVRQSVLDVCLLGSNKGFDIFGSFVVEFIKERFEATKSEPGVDLAIGVEKFFFGEIFDGNRTNGVGIVDVEDDNLSVAAVGCDGKGACLIGEEVAIDFVDSHENEMCARVVEFLGDILH